MKTLTAILDLPTALTTRLTVRNLRIVFALALTLPLYLGSAMLRHPFAGEYERYARELIGR